MMKLHTDHDQVGKGRGLYHPPQIETLHNFPQKHNMVAVPVKIIISVQSLNLQIMALNMFCMRNLSVSVWHQTICCDGKYE